MARVHGSPTLESLPIRSQGKGCIENTGKDHFVKFTVQIICMLCLHQYVIVLVFIQTLNLLLFLIMIAEIPACVVGLL